MQNIKKYRTQLFESLVACFYLTCSAILAGVFVVTSLHGKDRALILLNQYGEQSAETFLVGGFFITALVNWIIALRKWKHEE